MPDLDSFEAYRGCVPTTPFVGGETEAQRRMAEFLKQTDRVATFSKPHTDPTAFGPRVSTTVLSPHLKFGTLGIRRFYAGLHEVIAKSKQVREESAVLGRIGCSDDLCAPLTVCRLLLLLRRRRRRISPSAHRTTGLPGRPMSLERVLLSGGRDNAEL